MPMDVPYLCEVPSVRPLPIVSTRNPNYYREEVKKNFTLSFS